MFFIRNQTRRRHERIDQAIGDFYNFLDANNQEGGLINLEKSQFYRQNLDNLTIPNVRHGVMTIAKYALRNEDYIPIWSLKPGEKIASGDSSYQPTPRQRENISQIALSNGGLFEGSTIERSLLEFRSKHFKPSPITIDKESDAILSPEHFQVPSHRFQQFIYGRPVIILNQNYNLSSSHRPDTIAHELEHNSQYIDKPLLTYARLKDNHDLILQREIAAYRAQLPVLRELYRQGRQHEDINGYSHAELEDISDLTSDASLDSKGYVKLDNGYRDILADRLSERKLDDIAPGLNESELDRNLPYGPIVSSFPLQHAPEPATSNAQ